ncbi:MAG: FtsW/RodA/SpoVE family cell cycle protein [Erysipelotrichaceae bacterium]|nr:FtsW/RodA/SpoVE family cell cycle protein [Erysipelotrichaceae bacterium]
MKKLFSAGETNLAINLAVLVLTAFGSIMIVSASLGTSASPSGVAREAVKQAIIVAISLVIYWGLAKTFTWRKYKYVSTFAVMGVVILIAATLVVGRESGGAKAWLNFGGMSFQPSELAKPLLIVVCASAVKKYNTPRGRNAGFFDVFRTPLLLLGTLIAMIIVQKDMGTAAITLGIAVTCFLVPGWKGLRQAQNWIKISLAALMVIGVVTVYATGAASAVFRSTGFFSHMATRIDNMKNPYNDVYGEGYQPANALYALADAGPFGKGIGNSARKYGYLTQANSDYIFAVVVEETGLIGFGLIVALYGVILWQLFRYSLKARDPADKVLFCGTASYILLHFIANVGGVITMIPMTGVPLLFISGGGTSLMSICAALGICQSQVMKINREAEE